MRVIVVGAGIGGLTLAHALRRAGIDVVVFEGDGVQGRPQGVSLHLDDRGSSALRACLPPGHVAMVEATMGASRERKLVVSDIGGILTVTRAQPFGSGPIAARIGRQVNRRLLRAIMLTGLHDTVRFAMQFTRFEQRTNGTVRAWFADGSTDTADLLVGADGIGSLVRRQYLPDAQVVDTGKAMIFGETPLHAVADTGLPDLIGHNPAEVQIGGTTMVLAALRFAQSPQAARDRWLPTMDSESVTGFEDFVMWALPTTPDQLGPLDSTAAAWRWARDAVGDLHPVLRQVVEEASPDTVVGLRVGMMQPMTPWPAGPVTLLGDAMHPSPGFGANLAMRDAQLLRDELVLVERREHDLVTAIDHYEHAIRRDNPPPSTLSR